MKRGALILLLGLAVATAAFAGFYYLCTASCRKLMCQPQPELAWLKKEFHLTDAEFNRISQMHAAYFPKCQQRCQRIAEQDRQLQQLLASATSLTPQIQDLIAERARTRGECETEMMKHFLAVSQTMPPEEGRRYLSWVEEHIFQRGQGMEAHHHMEMDHAEH
jgi:hypothetical protein